MEKEIRNRVQKSWFKMRLQRKINIILTRKIPNVILFHIAYIHKSKSEIPQQVIRLSVLFNAMINRMVFSGFSMNVVKPSIMFLHSTEITLVLRAFNIYRCSRNSNVCFLHQKTRFERSAHMIKWNHRNLLEGELIIGWDSDL